MTESIHTAIAAVMNKVGYVQKTRSAEGGVPYSFAGEKALIEALRPAMVEVGIYMHVLEAGDVFRETYTTSNAKTMNRTALRVTVRFTHAPSGTSIDVQSVGEGSDTGDKSTPKALTGAYKYALRQTFCIETGDDPDGHSSEPQARDSAPAFVRPVQPAPIQQSAQGVPSDAPICVCGQPRVFKSGQKNNKPWKGWMCPDGQTTGDKPIWINDDDPDEGLR